jgi:hypothetical protein
MEHDENDPIEALKTPEKYWLVSVSLRVVIAAILMFCIVCFVRPGTLKEAICTFYKPACLPMPGPGPDF